MKQLQKIHKSIGLGMFIMLLVISGVFASQGGSTQVNDITRTIDVSGDAQLEIAPDQAVVRISVNSDGRDSSKVQEKNSRTMDGILRGCIGLGILEKDIETIRYSVHPKREYNSITRKYVTNGYTVQHTIKVTIDDLEKVGEILALAVENGATNVGNVQFTLSKEAEEAALLELYSLAAQKGQAKALAISNGLSMDLGRAIHISEMNYRPIQWQEHRYEAMAYEMEESVAAQAAPTINPQEQTLSVTLQMSFAVA